MATKDAYEFGGDVTVEKACQNIRAELIECLVATDACKMGKTLADALKDPGTEQSASWYCTADVVGK